MKIILSLLTIALGFAFATPTSSEIQKLPFFATTGIIVKDVYDAKSLYVVKAEHTRAGQKQVLTFFVTKDKKVVLQGQAYNEDVQVIEMPVDISKYKGKQGFTLGNTGPEFFVWTDPECPYCKKMKNLIKNEKLYEKATFHFYFFPLDFHKDAKEMSLWVLSQKTTMDKWKALESISDGTDMGDWKGYNQKASKKVKDLLDMNMLDATNLGITGTPTIYDINGKKVNWGNLPKMLK